MDVRSDLSAEFVERKLQKRKIQVYAAFQTEMFEMLAVRTWKHDHNIHVLTTRDTRSLELYQ